MAIIKALITDNEMNTLMLTGRTVFVASGLPVGSLLADVELREDVAGVDLVYDTVSDGLPSHLQVMLPQVADHWQYEWYQFLSIPMMAVS